MMEERRIGEVCVILHPYADITWRIPDFFNCAEVESSVDSPDFKFAGATWYLRFYPRGTFHYSKYVSLMIVNKQSHISNQTLFCNLGIRSISNDTFKDYTATYKFRENEGHGSEYFLEWHKILDNQDFVISNGALTIFWKIMNLSQKVSATDTSSQAQTREPTSAMDVNELSHSRKAIGELCVESRPSAIITWTIPYFFSLPAEVASSVDSPDFTFADATWCLRFYPNGKPSVHCNGCAFLMIVRKQSDISDHTIFCSFGIKQNGFECGETFKHSWTSHFTGYPEEGWPYFLEMWNLLNYKDSISSKGTVTMLWRMRQDTSEANASCQAESREYTLSKLGNVIAETSKNIGTISPLSTVACGEKVLQDLRKLLLDEECCDVTIQVKGETFRAHRAILRARSSVFAAMFNNDMKEKATGVVDVDDCEPFIFPDFLHFLYSGRVEKLSVDNVFNLYRAADKYDVQDLKSLCVEFLKNNLSVDSFCDTIRLCLQHSETELLKLSTDFFAKNLQEIIVSVKWQIFLAENTTQGNELIVKAMAYYKYTKM